MVLSLLVLTGCFNKYSEDTDEPAPEPVYVGPEGGELSFDGVSVVFPEGAVSEEIEIRIYETADDPPAEYDALSKVWAFEPHGLIFAEPVVVRLPYGPADASRPRIYWSNDDGGYDRVSPSWTSDEGGVIRAYIEHFSYAFVAQVATEIVEEPDPYPPADILFVVDNSCSMLEEQTALNAALPSVLPSVQATGLDWHIGVVTTDMDDAANGQGKLQTANGVSYIDPNTPDPEQTFGQMAVIGTNGFYEEKGRAAAWTMVEEKPDIPRNAGFVRDEATLSLIFVSDEEDQSGAAPISGPDFRDWLDTKKARPEDVIAHGFYFIPGTNCPTATPPEGQAYHNYVTHTGGVAASICATDWETPLQQMFDHLLDSARVVLPGPALEIVEVTADDGLTATVLDPADYTYDAASTTVYLNVRPAAGATVSVEYLPE
ncbi:MAG: hypothetical protein H6737_19230 [Alphaproteobacteria bacterium]|nr:hypothetical protein [Alphaproteobacteria bacterium]